MICEISLNRTSTSAPQLYRYW